MSLVTSEWMYPKGDTYVDKGKNWVQFFMSQIPWLTLYSYTESPESSPYYTAILKSNLGGIDETAYKVSFRGNLVDISQGYIDANNSFVLVNSMRSYNSTVKITAINDCIYEMRDTSDSSFLVIKSKIMPFKKNVLVTQKFQSQALSIVIKEGDTILPMNATYTNISPPLFSGELNWIVKVYFSAGQYLLYPTDATLYYINAPQARCKDINIGAERFFNIPISGVLFAYIGKYTSL